MRVARGLLPSSLLALALVACSGKDVPPGVDGGGSAGPDAGTAVPDTGVPAGNRYAGSASHGDLVTFDLDTTARKYTVHNETTQKDESGSYTVLSNELSGVYKVTQGTNAFYAVELNDLVVAANFPTGNPENAISFGVTSEPDNAGWKDHVAGNWVYISISKAPVNGSADNKEWGVISVDAAGTFKVRMLATGGTGSIPAVAPEDFTPAMLPTTDPDLTGTWAEAAGHPERLALTFAQRPGITFTGFAFADAQKGALIIDMGTGNGFLLAFKVMPGATRANTTGEYKFINVWNDAGGTGRSAGKAVVPATGDGSFAHLDENDQVSSGPLKTITQCPNLPNMFYATTEETGPGGTVHEKIYWVVGGPFFMSFGFRTDTGFAFASYAVGAKLD